MSAITAIGDSRAHNLNLAEGLFMLQNFSFTASAEERAEASTLLQTHLIKPCGKKIERCENATVWPQAILFHDILVVDLI